MANIYDVANELSRTLRDLPEYKAVVESKEAIEANPEAKTLFDEYVAFQNQLQGLMQSGQLPTEAVQQEMKDYMEKIQASPIVNEFFTKQQISTRVVISTLVFSFSTRGKQAQKMLGNIRFLFQIFDQKLNSCPNYDRI